MDKFFYIYNSLYSVKALEWVTCFFIIIILSWQRTLFTWHYCTHNVLFPNCSGILWLYTWWGSSHLQNSSTSSSTAQWRVLSDVVNVVSHHKRTLYLPFKYSRLCCVDINKMSPGLTCVVCLQFKTSCDSIQRVRSPLPDWECLWSAQYAFVLYIVLPNWSIYHKIKFIFLFKWVSSVCNNHIIMMS